MTPAPEAAGWWEPARQRALAALAAGERAHLERFGCGAESAGETGAVMRASRAGRDRILSPGWMPARKRRMATLGAIAAYWAGRNAFYMDPATPHCFACQGYVAAGPPATLRSRWNRSARWLDRAHLVDHAAGGLDGPQNLVPLCHACHRLMPSFVLGEGPCALMWVISGEIVRPPARAARIIRASVRLRCDGLYRPGDGNRPLSWLPLTVSA